jgi:hypothetical protein
MAEEFTSYKVRTRLVIVTAITIFLYIVLVTSLFFMKDIFQSLIFVFLFFISFHFFYLETQKYKLKYFFIGLLLLSIIEWLIIWFQVRQYRASLLALNMGIFAFVSTIETPIKRTMRFSSLNYFTIWWYIFTVFITITYSFALIWMYSQFPFNCEDLSKASSNVIDVFTKPFQIWYNEVKQIKNDTQLFMQANIQNVLWGERTEKPDSKILTTIDSRRTQLVDQVVKDNKSVNMWICDLVLKEINSRYDKPAFQFSLILLMYLLFYPFLRIIFWIMSIIWIIIFKILFGFKVYSIKKVTKEVEEIC